MPDLLVNGAIMLYGVVGDPWGDGTGFTDMQVAEALAAAPDGPVTVRINSPGGIAAAGMAIHTLLKERGCVVMIDGEAVSAASLIAMAGTEIIMARGATMMIHDPRTIVFGTTDDFAKAAKDLDTISESYAEVYAARSGKSLEDVRAIMKTETWFKAADAVAAGFATRIADAEAAAPVAFAYDLYRAAPAALPRRASPAHPAAAAALPKDGKMPDPITPAAATPVVPTVPAAGEQPKAWSHDIYLSAGKAGLTLAETNAIVAKATTRDEATAAIFDAIAAKAAPTLPDPNAQRVKVDADGDEKFRTGAAQALAAKGAIDKIDPKNEFNGITLLGLAQHVVARHGGRPSHDHGKIIMAAITHTSSEFPLILENVASKSLLKGFEEVAETYETWTGVGSLSDFKAAKRVDLNAFGNLPAKNEAGEYEYLTTGERGEIVQLYSRGGMVSLSREAIINDDVDAFAKLPRGLGRAARRTVGSAVYNVLINNGNMSDGVALFHAATHKNLATGGGSVLSQDALDAARTAMALQKDRSAKDATLNIRPKYLIVPVTLQGVATQLLSSKTAITAAGQPNAAMPNKVANMAEPVAEPRLDAASLTAWYLAAGNDTDTVEVQYLNGRREPILERDNPFMTDGVVFKVLYDFGVKALAWETLYKGAGA